MTINFDITVTIDGVNVSSFVKSNGTIDYGKSSRFTAFASPSARFVLFTKEERPAYVGTWPTVNLGDPIIIHVTWDGVTQWRRFTGVVQALDWSADGLVVTGAGTSVDWQNEWCGVPTGWAADITDEPETTRVTRWCGPGANGGANVSITVEGVSARRVRGIPVDSQTPQPLLDALLRIADDCDALLLEDRLGVVHYRTRNFDRPAPYTIPSGIIEMDTLDLAYERGTHYNAVRVYYGNPDTDTGNAPAVYANDTATYNTIATVGERLDEIYTDIQYQAGAEGKAAVYLERNRLEWSLVDVVLCMNHATGVQADALLDLQENWMVRVEDLPDGCPITAYDGDVLGFTEILNPDDYRMILHLGPRMADTTVPEEPIFAEDSCTGGTESTYEDGNGFLWQVHVFDTAGTSTLTCNSPVTGDLLLIGGGGGGAGNTLTYDGGGGGAGAVWNREVSLTPGTQSITVGAGGAAASGEANGLSGETSKFNDLWVYGGGGGGKGGTGGTGVAGGYGGGGGVGNSGFAQVGGAGTYGSLDAGVTTNTTEILGGDGGTSTVSAGGNGGGATLTSEITGTSLIYARGGRGGNYNAFPPVWTTAGSGGRGGSVVDGGRTAGLTGICVYRYRIG